MIYLVFICDPDNGFVPEEYNNFDSYLVRIKNLRRDPKFIPCDVDGVIKIGDIARTLFQTLYGDARKYDETSRRILQIMKSGDLPSLYGFTTIAALQIIQEKGIEH